MVDLKKKSNIKTIPMVSFDKIDDCIHFDALVSNWLGIQRDIGDIMGLIFIRLGFDEDDNIKLCNYNKEENSFQCIVNGDGFYSIKFKNINSNNRSGYIIIDRFDKELEYECTPLGVSEIGIKISLASCNVKYANGMIFTRGLSEKKAIFKVEFGDYVLELELEKPVDIELPLFDKTGQYSKYRLGNEEKLIEYLTSLKFPISIGELYKIICEISLGDVNVYPQMLLKLYKMYGDDKSELKVTDLIHLRNGELQMFGMTRNNKVYLLNKDDSWSCERLKTDSLVDFSMNVCGDEINYNVSFKNGNNDVKQLVESDIRIAQHEIERVRKLARILITKNNVNNDSN